MNFHNLISSIIWFYFLSYILIIVISGILNIFKGIGGTPRGLRIDFKQHD